MTDPKPAGGPSTNIIIALVLLTLAAIGFYFWQKGDAMRRAQEAPTAQSALN